MFHHNTLTGHVAVVTGAASGIGEAAAQFLAEAGAKVACLDVNTDSVSHNFLSIPTDISNPAQIKEAYDKIIHHLGRVDIVVANAGINGFWGPLEEFPIDEWDKVIAVNLRGTFLTVQAALPHLKQRGGSVIITASVNGTRMFSNTGATGYACSNAAQVAFCKMTALELAKYKIRVNVICPGSVRTNISESATQKNLETIREPVDFPAGVVPLKRGEPADPLDVAKLIWFLASPASSHISGTEVFIDGAQSLLQG